MSKNGTIPSEQKSEKNSFFKKLYQYKAAIGGALGGFFEVGVDQPLWTLKTRYQDKSIPKKEKLTADLKVLYRGVVPNMLSMIPITALQISCAEKIKSAFKIENKPEEKKEDDQMAELIKLFASMGGGGFSSIVSGPTELIMACQTEKSGFIATAKQIASKHGIKGLTTGMVGTAGRDALFTGGYLFGIPYLTKQLKPYCSDEKAKLGGGILAGVTSSTLSHPFDTFKTEQQTGLKNGEITTNLWNMAKKKVKQEGIKCIKTSYKGFGFRTLRVISGVNIISNVNEQVSSFLKNRC